MSHQYSRVGVDLICGVSVAGRADWPAVLEPGVGSRWDALLVPTEQLHHRARHGRSGDFAGRCVWRHWATRWAKHEPKLSRRYIQEHFLVQTLPRTLRVTLVSPRLTASRWALISQRYSPASSWVTLCSVTVAPSMVARPSKEPEGNIRRSWEGNVSSCWRLQLLRVRNKSLLSAQIWPWTWKEKRQAYGTRLGNFISINSWFWKQQTFKSKVLYLYGNILSHEQI